MSTSPSNFIWTDKSGKAIDISTFVPTMSDDILLEMNGDFEAGIATASAGVYDKDSHITFGNGVIIVASDAAKIAAAKGITDQELVDIVIAAAVVIEKFSLFDKFSNCNRVETPRALAVTDDKTAYKKATVVSATAAVTLIFAAKVNWFQTNHNVGQGEVTGFIAKVIAAKFAKLDAKKVATVAWIIAHWASSLTVLGAIGVPGVPKAKFGNFVPTDDVTLRAFAMPAGSAKLGFIISALRRLNASIYVKYVTHIYNYEAAVREYTAVKTDPFKYHPAARVILGEGKTVNIDPDLLEACIAFVGAALPGSSLSKAAVMTSINKSHLWYLSCLTAKNSISSVSKVTADDITKDIKAKIEEGQGIQSLQDALKLLNPKEDEEEGEEEEEHMEEQTEEEKKLAKKEGTDGTAGGIATK